MDLQFLCFAFCGLVIVVFYLGIRIGFGAGKVALLAHLEAVRQRERLRAALRQARLYVDGTLGPDRPVAVAEIDRALEGASDKSDGLDKSEKLRGIRVK